MANVFEKLQTARVELQKKALKKSGKNNYAGFEYYDLSDFLPAVNEIFYDLKLFSNFSINGECATLSIIDIEKTEDVITFTSPVEELELKGCNKIQALGGVHTYLKRYLYINALEIVENDTFDRVSGREAKRNSAPAKNEKEADKISENDEKIFALIENVNEIKALSEFYNKYKESVKNRKSFYSAVQKRREKLLNK